MPKTFMIPALVLLSVAVMAQTENGKTADLKQEATQKVASKEKKQDRYFCADATVTMADGTVKAIRDVKVGEKVKTCMKGKSIETQVKEVEVYANPDAALMAVYLRPVNETSVAGESWPLVPALLLEATPHHQVQTKKGNKTMKQLSKNDVLYHYEPATGKISSWKVGIVQTNARKVTTAYNLTTEDGSYLIENVLVSNN